MRGVVSTLDKELSQLELNGDLVDGAKTLGALVDEAAYVGEVFSLSYESALVQIHDFHRQKVGGIPALSFLIAEPTEMTSVL
jgi:hypothetical protein